MVITIAFGKGGSCKTTTAAALVNYAKSKGKTVLAIDCDPQGNFTFALNGDATAPGLHSVLIDGMAAADAVQTTEQADLIAAGLDLAAAETAIANRPGRDFILTDYFAASNEEEESRRTEFLRLRKEQGICDDAFYHFDTPLTVDHEKEALLIAGFSSVTILGAWGPTYTLKAER